MLTLGSAFWGLKEKRLPVVTNEKEVDEEFCDWREGGKYKKIPQRKKGNGKKGFAALIPFDLREADVTGLRILRFRFALPASLDRCMHTTD